MRACIPERAGPCPVVCDLPANTAVSMLMHVPDASGKLEGDEEGQLARTEGDGVGAGSVEKEEYKKLHYANYFVQCEGLKTVWFGD